VTLNNFLLNDVILSLCSPEADLKTGENSSRWGGYSNFLNQEEHYQGTMASGRISPKACVRPEEFTADTVTQQLDKWISPLSNLTSTSSLSSSDEERVRLKHKSVINVSGVMPFSVRGEKRLNSKISSRPSYYQTTVTTSSHTSSSFIMVTTNTQ